MSRRKQRKIIQGNDIYIQPKLKDQMDFMKLKTTLIKRHN